MCVNLFVQTSSTNLDRPCGEHLDDLKFVLSEIANIRKISLDVELQYRSVSFQAFNSFSGTWKYMCIAH